MIQFTAKRLTVSRRTGIHADRWCAWVAVRGYFVGVWVRR